MTVNIQKWGNSQGIRIPKHMLDSLAWSPDETVDISIEDGKIIIERFCRTERKNIKELFEGFKGKYGCIFFPSVFSAASTWATVWTALRSGGPERKQAGAIRLYPGR